MRYEITLKANMKSEALLGNILTLEQAINKVFKEIFPNAEDCKIINVEEDVY